MSKVNFEELLKRIKKDNELQYAVYCYAKENDDDELEVKEMLIDLKMEKYKAEAKWNFDEEYPRQLLIFPKNSKKIIRIQYDPLRDDVEVIVNDKDDWYMFEPISLETKTWS